MPAVVPAPPERLPRRARYLIPLGTPRRAEFLAVAGLATLLAGVLFAQLTLVLGVAFHVVGRVTRLSPLWLLGPAVCGAVLLLALRPGPALAGFAAAGGAVAALLRGVLADPASLPRLAGIPGVIGRLAGAQLPLALILAAGLAFAGWWLRWLHTSEWELPACRAGLVVRCRRWWTLAFAGSGGILTRDGACLGADLATGRPAAVSWAEAAAGVLVTGAVPAAVAAGGFRFAHAAIRRRTPVLVVDLGGDPGLPAELAAACAAAGAPLYVFGDSGTGCYEPLAGHDPGRAAALVMGTFGLDGLPGPARMACRECLVTAFAVCATMPAESSGAVLDELAALLRPGELRTAAGRVPAWHPLREELAARAGSAEGWLGRDPDAAALLAGQITALRSSELGRRLWPGGGAPVSLDEVVRRRAVALFRLGPYDMAGLGTGNVPGTGYRLGTGDVTGTGNGPGAHSMGGTGSPRDAGCWSRAGGVGGVGGHAPELAARLVALDISTHYAGLHRAGLAPGVLAWFSECGPVGPMALAALAGAGDAAAAGHSVTPGATARTPRPATPRSGLVPVLTTSAPEVAAELAGQAGVCVIGRLADRGLAAQLAALTGTRWVPAAGPLTPGVPLPGGESSAGETLTPAVIAGRGRRVPAGALGGGIPPFGLMRAFVVGADMICNQADDGFCLAVRAGGRPSRVVARGRWAAAPAQRPGTRRGPGAVRPW